MAMQTDEIPERRENWAEAEFKGGAKSVITLKSGHVLVSDEPAGFAGGAGGENAGPTPTGFLAAAFAADIPVILQRIAREQAISLQSIGVRVSIAWNPRGIAGLDGVEPTPFEAVSNIRICTDAPDHEIDALKLAYERRCPLYNLLRKSGCRMIENWRIEKPSP
ncbi:MAG: OsmC family protein [Alphaproteobacteria bacterium]